MDHSVLVVDDLQENIKIISHQLREIGVGKKLYSAPNGKIALELIEKYNPDLIITDWEMPLMNGLELVKSLKKSEKYCDIPVIMVTAVKIDSAHLQESFDAGVHDYLRKPFSKLEFNARIKATLRFQEELIANKKGKIENAKQAEVINNQNVELIKLVNLKSKFLSIILQDISAPLADLINLLNIFENEEDQIAKKPLKKFYFHTRLKVRNVVSFLNNLKFWSKTHIQDRKIQKSEIKLKELVEEVFELFLKRANFKRINFFNEINNGLVINNDKEILAFILRNLIDNAIKYTLEGGVIVINCGIENDKITIDIADTRIGMDSKFVEIIFPDEGENTPVKGTSGEVGTSLGLRLSKDFAEQLKGHIKVKSIERKGSVFSLVLPLNL